MSDNKVTMDQLDNSAIEAMTSSIGDVNMLNTENKTIVGAITEIAGKKIIADAIGEPLTKTDKFAEMGNGINGLLSTFKTNMMNAGVVVENGDKFKELIEKIQGLTEGEGNKGVKYVEGEVTLSANVSITVNAEHTIEIDDLGFTPTLFVLIGGFYGSTMGFNNHAVTNISDLIWNYPNAGTIGRGYTISNVTQNSFSVKALSENGLNGQLQKGTFKWYAIGVGEEDNTLRDSLASILEGEGIEVTEEDNMATLITKVDEEFAKDNNTISEYESNKDRLYELMLEGGYEVDSNMNLDDMLSMLELSGIVTDEIIQVAIGSYHSFVLKKDGRLYACGVNTFGQFGTGGTNSNNQSIFIHVADNVKQVYCWYGDSFILKNDDSLWACGDNNYGQLGLGKTTQINTFTQVTTDVKQVVCRYFSSFILKNDGSLWACGQNTYGQLGLGDKTNKTTFTQVTTNINNDVKEIACGGYYYSANDYCHVMVLKNDGTLWACGNNAYGKLGLGDNGSTTYITTFTQVTTNINNDVKQVACGGQNTFIIKNDGSLWVCGYGEYGNGLSSTSIKYTFTQVTTNINNDVKEVICGLHHTFIIKNDGSIWACGNNGHGQLGLGDTTNRTTFTQVTTNINNDVKEIACGDYTTLMIKNDDGVWGCGWNNYGQLGINNTSEKNIINKAPSTL